MTIRAVVVDDEEPARARLCALLAELGDVEVVGTAGDVEAALALVADTEPHVVFLDIQMPGRSGLELTAALPPPRPRVIFCTAFDEYALNAFEQDAVDYLLKPLNRVRLARAVERVRRSVAERETQQHELAVASRAQARLLPQTLPGGSLSLAGLCRPARGVGGDYYDVLTLADGQRALVVGDVSGKGLYAGLLMAGLQGRLQTLARQHGQRLDALMADLNRQIVESTEGDKYATLFYAVYDEPQRRLIYVNAGHCPPLVVRAQGSVERLAPTGTVVGLMTDARYEAARVWLEAGDTLVLYSDGVTEATNPASEEFGENGLEQVAVQGRALPPAELLERIVEAVDRFVAPGHPGDDLTVLVARQTA